MKIVDEVICDLNDAQFDTIKEKYEYLYVFLLEKQKKLTANNGVVALTANHLIVSIFEMAMQHPNHSAVDFYANGILKYIGNFHNPRWSLWQDSTLPLDEVWLYNNTEGIKVIVANLII